MQCLFKALPLFVLKAVYFVVPDFSGFTEGLENRVLQKKTAISAKCSITETGDPKLSVCLCSP